MLITSMFSKSHLGLYSTHPFNLLIIWVNNKSCECLRKKLWLNMSLKFGDLAHIVNYRCFCLLTFLLALFLQISKSSCIQMAGPLDLWVHGLGQYKAFTSLCIPQHQAEVSDCADKGIPGSTAKKLMNHTKHVHYHKVKPLLTKGQLFLFP